MDACNGDVAVLREMENIPGLEAVSVILTFFSRHIFLVYVCMYVCMYVCIIIIIIIIIFTYVLQP